DRQGSTRRTCARPASNGPRCVREVVARGPRCERSPPRWWLPDFSRCVVMAGGKDSQARSKRKPRGGGQRAPPPRAASRPAAAKPRATGRDPVTTTAEPAAAAPSDAQDQEGPRPAVPSRFPIVGIGASAGGLEALEQFLKHMPKDSGIAFVVVQHL